jgi:hypothetical protein
MADRLYEGVKQVIDEGRPPEAVIAVLHDLYLTAEAEGHDVARDAIAEVMDCVVGWTSGKASLQTT